jgi:hypothetical protein
MNARITQVNGSRSGERPIDPTWLKLVCTVGADLDEDGSQVGG